MTNVRCKQCKHALVQGGPEGIKLRLKGSILIKADGSCVSQCYWCGTETDMPLKLDGEALQKAQTDVDGPRFIMTPAKTKLTSS